MSERGVRAACTACCVGVLVGVVIPLLPPDMSIDFERDRPDLDRVVAWLEERPGLVNRRYVELPSDLADLAVTGDIDVGDGTVFIPRWVRIVDDAGGYWYSPSGSPEGFDMRGMICQDPVRLDGGWWTCGV